MSPRTATALKAITEFANEGNEILPMFFSPFHGSATVSAAIRVAKNRGLIVQDGVDGCGKPKYIAADMSAMATHPGGAA